MTGTNEARGCPVASRPHVRHICFFPEAGSSWKHNVGGSTKQGPPSSRRLQTCGSVLGEARRGGFSDGDPPSICKFLQGPGQNVHFYTLHDERTKSTVGPGEGAPGHGDAGGGVGSRCLPAEDLGCQGWEGSRGFR